jgi:hypothetical protein
LSGPEVARNPQLDIRAAVIRFTIALLLVACVLMSCRSGREETGTTIYEGQPVAVLPPETAPPPPVSAPRPRETYAPSPEGEREAEAPPPPATPRATPRVTVNTEAPQFPVAKPVPGKPGFVYSPFESNGTMIDVTGYSSGTKVKDPGTNKIFIVP